MSHFILSVPHFILNASSASFPSVFLQCDRITRDADGERSLRVFQLDFSIGKMKKYCRVRKMHTMYGRANKSLYFRCATLPCTFNSGQIITLFGAILVAINYFDALIEFCFQRRRGNAFT